MVSSHVAGLGKQTANFLLGSLAVNQSSGLVAREGKEAGKYDETLTEYGKLPT